MAQELLIVPAMSPEATVTVVPGNSNRRLVLRRPTMSTIRATQRVDVLESRRGTTKSRDALLPWADPYIAGLQRIDSPAANWPDRPHFVRQPASSVRGEAPPPLGESPLPNSDEREHRSAR